MKRTDRRSDMPAKLVGAAHFDRNAEDFAPAALVRIAKQCSLLDGLREDTDYSCESVREREPGDWALAFLAFASSPIPDMRPWWRDSSADMWWEAGFKKRPDYDLMYTRFVELEERGGIEAFFEASALLIRLAILSSGGLVCRDVTCDGTEAEANARMFHDCQPGEGCPGLKNQRKRRNPKREYLRSAARMETSEARKIRGAAAETLPDDEHAPIAGDADELVHDSDGNLLRVRCADHWWRITDPTAGCRTKEGKRGGVTSFIGHTDLKMDCTLVGLSAVRVLQSASTQEYDIYPTAYEKLKYILDGVPRSVIADKGLSIKRVFQMHSDDGVFSVMPFRGSSSEPLPVDRERWDRYGRPRCENCGGRCRFASFSKTPEPRVFFECVTKPFAECQGRQQLRCSEDPRFILPLWRGTPLYEALEDSGMEYERTHRLTRQRHGSGGNNFGTRPKRKGRDWQQLVANASIVSDWLKLCWRNGWLPGTSAQTSLDVTRIDGEHKSDDFEARYQDKGLNGHYGERAAALKKGPWRVPQYRRAELNDVPSQAAPARPRGGPRRRALTELPSDAPERVKQARRQFFALQAASENGGAAAKKSSSKKSGSKGTGSEKSAVPAKAPAPGEQQRQRARRGRAKRGPDPPT